LRRSKRFKQFAGESAVNPFETALVWCIAAGVIAGVLFRPLRWPEAVWAAAGAFLLVSFGLVPFHAGVVAARRGTDVYLFLTGMMLLAELARREGVFDWLAGLAVRTANGSGTRLFMVIYCVGILVTVFLSNDATAVVLTPAVYASVKRARADALSCLFVCAFIANAASFVLPISNPANLVVYGKQLPPLGPWLRTFLIPSVASIGVTYAVMRWVFRKQVQGDICKAVMAPPLSSEGQRAAWGIVASAVALIGASALGFDLGVPTCAAAILAVVVTTGMRPVSVKQIATGVAWSVLPLVAGLFVLVEGLNRAGTLRLATRALQICGALPRVAGALSASFGIAALSNIMNNLPSGLLAGSAVQSTPVAPWLRDSVLIGVDLGPNLSVTGSLATILWLIALRREGIELRAMHFLKMGLIVMPPALLLSTLALVLF
jgi:arsenical pump membrane protein